jgi:hypothetical protein
MKRQWESQALFLVWAVTALVIACFHEPWRDEAQAWLVVRSSESFWELLIRASIEATGPIYYLILWGPAQAFPALFPQLIFLFSFLGVALFVRDFSRSSFVPLRWRWAIVLGFMIGYEYAVVARLYGWGCFFFWRGIMADRENSPKAPYWFAVACLTQLSFFVAILGWLTHRLLHSYRRASWNYYWPLAVAVAVMLAHGTLGAHHRSWAWVQWHDWMPFLRAFGTAVATPFVHGPKLAVSGVVVLIAALLPLSGRARFALLISLSAFIFIFVFRYHGTPSVRHGGAIFLLWIALAADQSAHSRFSVRLIYILLAVNFITGLGMRAQEVLYPFGHAQAAANAVEQRTKQNPKPIRIYVDKGENGLTLAALLNTDLWTRGKAWGCPFFAGSCTPPPPLLDGELQAGIAECAKTHLCLYATGMFDKPDENRDGVWLPLYKPVQPALRESLSLYEFAPNMTAPKDK